jgi:hypothetical protein
MTCDVDPFLVYIAFSVAVSTVDLDLLYLNIQYFRNLTLLDNHRIWCSRNERHPSKKTTNNIVYLLPILPLIAKSKTISSINSAYYKKE